MPWHPASPTTLPPTPPPPKKAQTHAHALYLNMVETSVILQTKTKQQQQNKISLNATFGVRGVGGGGRKGYTTSHVRETESLLDKTICLEM